LIKDLPPIRFRGSVSRGKADKKISQSASGLLGRKSLNLIVRKRETERIEQENQAFAKRLFDKPAFLQKEKLDK